MATGDAIDRLMKRYCEEAEEGATDRMTDSAEKTTTASKERRRWLDIRREVYKEGYTLIGYEKFLAEGEPVRIADWRAQDFAEGYVEGHMERKAYRRWLHIRLILLLDWSNEDIARLLNNMWDEGPALTTTGVQKRRKRLADCLCNPRRAAALARNMEKPRDYLCKGVSS